MTQKHFACLNSKSFITEVSSTSSVSALSSPLPLLQPGKPWFFTSHVLYNFYVFTENVPTTQNQCLWTMKVCIVCPTSTLIIKYYLNILSSVMMFPFSEALQNSKSNAHIFIHSFLHQASYTWQNSQITWYIFLHSIFHCFKQ